MHKALSGVLNGISFLAVVYLLTVGGTWQGMMQETTARLSLGCLALLLMVWSWRRRSSPWHHTRLDGVILLWIVAIAISSAVNLQALPQIATGLWFVGLYVVVWYVLQDVQTNDLKAHSRLLAAFFGAGGILIISGLILAPFALPERVGGLLENPNNLGAFLLLLIPLMIARRGRAGRVERIVIGVGLVLAGIVLVLTGSRGAMMGLATAFMLVAFFRYRTLRSRLVLAILYIGLVVLLFQVRGDNGRIRVYNNVLIDITQHPLTGTGLFTYRLREFETLTPGGTLLYAHNLFFHAAVELGVLGVVAMGVSLLVLFRAKPGKDDRLRLWAYAAIVGTGVHQLLDFPVMMPSNALSTLIVLSLALSPRLEPGRAVYARLIEGIAVVLILLGVVFVPLRIE